MERVARTLLVLTALSSTLLPGKTAMAGGLSIRDEPFGCTRDGKEVRLFALTNTNGLTAKVMTYGATIYSMEVPDRQGRLVNVTANRATLADYEERSGAFGALLGRYANRIAKGRLVVDGQEYSLPLNGGPNHIHGGPKGFDKQVWEAKPIQKRDGVALRLNYASPDGESGFPGRLKCTVVYELNNANEWKMEYSATTDKATVVNLSNHAYWNLAGACSGTVLNHLLTVNAESYLPVDDTLIPTGEIAPVAGTPLDFRTPHRIGERIGEIAGKHFRGGYDHCLVLQHQVAGDLTFCARLADPGSGRVMEVFTTQPGVQVYSANFESGTLTGPGNYPYPKHAGFCLETQHFPDSPNKPSFPSTLLRPGETFHSVTVHKFSVLAK